jgi:hypothetical protein
MRRIAFLGSLVVGEEVCLSQVCSVEKAVAAHHRCAVLCCAVLGAILSWHRCKNACVEVHHGGLISAVGGKVGTPQACSIMQEMAD